MKISLENILKIAESVTRVLKGWRRPAAPPPARPTEARQLELPFGASV
jgi:hypothetical protein